MGDEVEKGGGEAVRLVRLFWEMFKVSLFVVGGGYAIVAVAEDVFARRLKWTREGEIVEKLPLLQMVPGIMAGHCAVYVGNRVAGPVGSVFALAGVTLPSFAIFLAVSAGFAQIPIGNVALNAVFAGLRAALAGVVGALCIETARKCIVDFRSASIFAVSLTLLALRVPAVFVIALTLAVGVASSVGRSSRFRSTTLPAIALVFLKFGTLAFGGGYALVPLYLDDFIGSGAPMLQLAETDFANLMALTQMTPGPIGINAATFFGYRLGGVAGASVATVALVTPGFAILLGAFLLYPRLRGNRCVIGALAAVRPVTVALTAWAFWAFAGMSAWSFDRSAGLVLHPISSIAIVAVIIARLRWRIGVMQLVVATSSAFLAARLLAEVFR